MNTAFLLGLASSLHCVGMCAPLTFALPLPALERFRLTASLLVYHVGRLTTYAFLGAIFGVLGKGLVLAGWQQVLSLTFGGLLLGASVLVFYQKTFVSAIPLGGFFSKKLKQALSKALRGRGLFVAGLLNGFLPCGMVYLALAGALVSTSAWYSALYMFFFGLGTLPALLAVVLFGKSLDASLRRRLRWVQPVLMALAGLLLLQRGWGIDLSTWDSSVPQAGFDCH